MKLVGFIRPTKHADVCWKAEIQVHELHCLLFKKCLGNPWENIIFVGVMVQKLPI